MNLFVIICFFLLLVVIIIDLIPIFYDWLSRIKLGSYSDISYWSNEITNKGSIWLKHTPKVRVTDNTRLIVIDILKRNYSKSAIQHWQEASLVLGLSEYLKYKDDLEVKKILNKFLENKFDATGNWVISPNNIDAAILAYSIMKIDNINIEKYRKALDYIWELIKDHLGHDGTVQYRRAMTNYRYVDTIGFICPFLVTYGLRFHKEECVNLAIKQIQEYEKYGMLEHLHIPCHSYNVENKVPLGLYGWGRGLGWFAIGLIDAWRELPKNHKNKITLEKSIKKFAQSAMKLQQDNGSWNWTVTRPESRADSSTTATLAWFLINAADIDSISNDSIKSTKKAINYLISVTRRNGSIDFSQGDTKDIGVYSNLFNILPFTQGFSIRCINRYLNISDGNLTNNKSRINKIV